MKFTTSVLLFLLSIFAYPQTNEYWGMTMQGGDSDLGSIFKTDTDGNNQEVVFSFTEAEGKEPAGSLLQATNGLLYGMTFWGGVNDHGVIFEVDPATGTYTKKVDFNNINGSKPYGSLVQHTNGNLYGMTRLGGANSKGVLFEFNPETGTYTVKIDFDGTICRFVHGSLLLADNEKFYGLSHHGGTSDEGSLFEYDPTTNTLTKKYDFDNTNGRWPNYDLLQASNGKLYGTSSRGGLYDLGVLFEFDLTTGTFAKKYDFATATGTNPDCNLIQTADDKLYGVTTWKGDNNRGVLFEYDLSTDTYAIKYHFDDTDGGRPLNSLMLASDGNIYGMTNYGGTNDTGVIFSFDPTTSTYDKKLDFNTTNGAGPRSHLTEVEIPDDDVDDDGFTTAEDCDDNNPNVNPDQEEILYNGINDDCNAETLDDDLDEDGFLAADDCDDSDPAVNADQTEIPYNGIDDDCNTETPDDDLDGDGFPLSEDCDDTNPNLNTAAEVVVVELEVCGSYDFDGETLTESGFYEGLFTKSTGCDSLVILDLTVKEAPLAEVTFGGHIILASDQEDVDYQWYDCDTNEPIDGEVDRIFVPAEPGSYYVEVTNENCTVTSECLSIEVILSTPSGNQEVKIFPNPATDYIFFKANNRELQSVELYDLAGNRLLQTIGEDKIDVRTIKEGVYLLVVYHSGQKTARKIAISR